MDYWKKIRLWILLIGLLTTIFLKTAQADTLCDPTGDPFLVALQREVAPGDEYLVLAVSESPIDGVSLVNGHFLNSHNKKISSGPPHALQFNMHAPQKTGKHIIKLVNYQGRQLACTVVTVKQPDEMEPAHLPDTGIWEIRRPWTQNWERVFSVWIEHLFRPLKNKPNKGWKPLHSVLRNRERNFLYNRLGYNEDDPNSKITVKAIADCGDTPFQLRAYFAWKFGLAFRFRNCSRGSAIKGPRCKSEFDNRIDKFDKIEDPVNRFNAFIGQSIAWNVHSGTMRTLPYDETSDFYPIALDRKSIRPGTIFVDVGGHVLMISQWNEDGLFAIDGHPDKTVTRKRFSQKYFPYFRGGKTGGFKAFRPIKIKDGRIVPFANDALKNLFFSLDQYIFTSGESFYQKMKQLIGDA